MTSPVCADMIVIGAGIAGAGVAANLAPNANVILLEMEPQPGYHTTGRSAAIYAPSYGPNAIRSLTRASWDFFQSPPPGFATHALLTPRDILMIARADQLETVDKFIAELPDPGAARRLTGGDLMACQPLLRPDYAVAGVFDQGGRDIDVNGLHQGFLRQFKSAGGTLITNAAVSALHRSADTWHITAGGQRYNAPIAVNAAGAWADVIADLAGAGSVGLVPKRRTALLVASPDAKITDPLPITVDIDERFYLKPDAGRLLLSPADETPSAPCDAQPEELDIAVCVDLIQTAFDLNIKRIENTWAGLRSFVPDDCPVVGYSQTASGFFWLAAQGGYGIQTAPALSELAAALVLGQPAPDYILSQGLDVRDLSPARYQ